MTVNDMVKYLWTLRGVLSDTEIIDMVQLLLATEDIEFVLDKVLYLLK